MSRFFKKAAILTAGVLIMAVAVGAFITSPALSALPLSMQYGASLVGMYGILLAGTIGSIRLADKVR